jgi:cadmium resistance protein CadD (predicted permease)
MHTLAVKLTLLERIVFVCEDSIRTRREKKLVGYWLGSISIACFVAAFAVPHGSLFKAEILAGLAMAALGCIVLYLGRKRRRRRRRR